MEEGEGKCCKIFSYIMVCVSTTGIVLCCLLGFAFTQKLVGSLGLFICNLVTLFYDVQQGEEKKTLPKFIGLVGLDTLLTDSQKQVDQIVTDVNTKFTNLAGTWTTDDPKALKDQLTTVYDTFKNRFAFYY
jgi:hypothetical protein